MLRKCCTGLPLRRANHIARGGSSIQRAVIGPAAHPVHFSTMRQIPIKHVPKASKQGNLLLITKVLCNC